MADRSLAPNTDCTTNRRIDVAYVGVASPNDAMYATWQDSRSGSAVTQAEDGYEASVKFNSPYIPPPHHSRGVPTWLIFLAGSLLGIGLTAAPASVVVRRSGVSGQAAV